jgi:NADH-quinone oxidoreductase subunit F
MVKKQFIEALNQSTKEQFAFTCKGFDLIICVGTLPSRHDTTLLKRLSESEAKLVYLFTMEDQALVEKSSFFSRYEVGSEEGVFALLSKSFLKDVKLPESIQSYFEELDEGYISAESNLGEEEIEEIEALYEEAKDVLLVLGDDVIRHPRATNIAHLAGLIARYGKAKLFVVGAISEEIMEANTKSVLEEIADLKSFDGVVVYQCPVINKEEENSLIGSAQFQMAAKVQSGDKINVTINQEVYPRTFVRDDSLKGVIALMPCAKADSSYPYHVVKIVKAEVQ